MNNIFWLSSYPKSGNTLLRLILCGLFFTEDGTLEDFNVLRNIPKFDSLSNFEFIKKLSIEDYEIIFSKEKYNEHALITYSKYWIEAQKRIIANKTERIFFKTHNARVKLANNFYTNETTTAAFIYLLRDPRDIIISYSNYLNQNYDDVIDFMINGQLRGNEKIDQKMPEILLSWENNYISWKNFNTVPSLFLKYEDFNYDVEKEIQKILFFFEKHFSITFNNKKTKLKNIINNTDIKNLQARENQIGFYENSDNKSGKKFFRKGQVNQWKKELSRQQLNKIEKNFEKTLNELNYL